MRMDEIQSAAIFVMQSTYELAIATLDFKHDDVRARSEFKAEQANSLSKSLCYCSMMQLQTIIYSFGMHWKGAFPT